MAKIIFLFLLSFLSLTPAINAKDIAILPASSKQQNELILSALNRQTAEFETALTSDKKTNDTAFYLLLKQYDNTARILNQNLIANTYLPDYPEDSFIINFAGFKIYQDEAIAFIGIDWPYLQQKYGKYLSAPANFWLSYKIKTAETAVHDPETAGKINKIYLSYREKARQADRSHTDFLETTYWQEYN